MFDKDLFDANITEIAFVKRLLKPWVIKVEFWQDWDWDIRITYRDWHSVTFEVKDNNRATHNIVVEYEYKWHPSWIFTSKADYIIYLFDNTWYRQKRTTLIENINKYVKRETKWWDKKNSSLYLIDKERAKHLFNELKDEMQNILQR